MWISKWIDAHFVWKFFMNLWSTRVRGLIIWKRIILRVIVIGIFFKKIIIFASFLITVIFASMNFENKSRGINVLNYIVFVRENHSSHAENGMRKIITFDL